VVHLFPRALDVPFRNARSYAVLMVVLADVAVLGGSYAVFTVVLADVIKA